MLKLIEKMESLGYSEFTPSDVWKEAQIDLLYELIGVDLDVELELRIENKLIELKNDRFKKNNYAEETFRY